MLVALRQSGLLSASKNMDSNHRIGGRGAFTDCGYEIAFHKAMATFNHQVVFDVKSRTVSGWDRIGLLYAWVRHS